MMKSCDNKRRIDHAKDCSKYDLDVYKRQGIDSQTIDRIFDELKEGLRPLLENIQTAKQPDLSALKGTYDISAQKKVQDLLLTYIGFD